MSQTLPTSLSDFSSAVDRLEASGSNWMIFQHRFMIAVKQKKVWGQFDGSNVKPTRSFTLLTTTQGEEYQKNLLAWQEQEDLAQYLLMQKLPDSIFVKYIRKTSVAEIWTALVTEFTKKCLSMKAGLRSEFMALRYRKGADLRLEFDRVRMKYETLMNAGIPVTDDDYRILIINFVPPSILAFIAQLSATMKAMALMKPAALTALSSEVSSDAYVLDPESLMQLIIDE